MSWSSSSSIARRVVVSSRTAGSDRPGSSGSAEPHILRTLAATTRVGVGLIFNVLTLGQRIERALGKRGGVKEDLAAILGPDEPESAITNQTSDDPVWHGAS